MKEPVFHLGKQALLAEADNFDTMNIPSG